jgi:hypothetical protein
MAKEQGRLARQSTDAEIAAFLEALARTPAEPRATGRGRLLFGLDATASREPTWDAACDVQAQMFEETRALGGLEVQLCFYRGYQEFSASPWVSDPGALATRMAAVRCAAGYTQVVRLVEHAVEQTRQRRLSALVFVGDCMEEKLEDLLAAAGRLALAGVPAFLFHEGFDPSADRAFREVARLTRGAYCRFDAASARQLRELLAAVAVYASGGRTALDQLADRQGGLARLLSQQIQTS